MRQPIAHHGIVERPVPVGSGAVASLQQPAEARTAQALGQLQHRHPALGAQGGLGDLPAAVFLADQILGRDLHVVEEDLAEVRVADGVADRPHIDPGCGHVQQEVGDAVPLGCVQIGAGQ